MTELYQRIASAIEFGEEEEAVALTEQALKEGCDPVGIIQEAFSVGVLACGQKYNDGVFFLPDLMLTGEAMKAGLALVMPALTKVAEGSFGGKVLMGAVEGDVHDIGKNICLSILLANGFEIVDAGVNLPSDRLVALVAEHQPDIVGLGSYMSTTLPALAESVRRVKESGYNGHVVVGGVAVNARWADEIDVADGYADDAWGCVNLCQSLVGTAEQTEVSGYGAGSDKVKIR
ncbi:MAG: cobalamin-dependent protein [Thermoleophilia bacterium]|nr:cobalamin-dependent protein [Thermoleophilia bacterium]